MYITNNYNEKMQIDYQINNRILIDINIIERNIEGSILSLNPDNIAKELTNFIKEQEDGKVTVSVSRFDNEYEQFLNYVLSSEINITGEDIKPRGMTALTESLCRLIDDTGKELSEMKIKILISCPSLSCLIIFKL
jgi:hypothetical protein